MSSNGARRAPVTPTSISTARLLGEIAESIPSIVFIAGASGAEHLSERFVEYTGMSVEDGLGTGWREVVHAHDLERAMSVAVPAVAAAQTFHIEARLRGRDGRYRWHDVRVAPLRRDGVVVRWFGLCSDNDAPRRAEVERSRGAEISRTLAQATTTSELAGTFARTVTLDLCDFCAIDLDERGGAARRVSAVLAAGCGVLPDALATMPGVGGDVTVPTSVPNALLAPLRAESVVVVPMTLPGERRGRVWLGTLGRAPAFDEQDLEMCTSLVERLATGFAHARLLDAVHRESHLRDELVRIVSHELRTPLSTVLGWARLLRESFTDAARVRHGLEVIERSAAAQTRILDDLLDASRAMSGKLRLEPRDASISGVVREVVDVMRPPLEQKGLTLELSVDGALVAPIDAERIRQVVSNLLSNAMKFTPSGGTVRVRCESRAGWAIVRVEDSGTGIDASFLPYVFDRFQHPSSSASRHSGLGLALVRAIIEQHGGTASAASAIGEGTTITVELPLVRAEGVRPIPQRLATPSRDLAGLRIVLVDDEPDARELSSMLFAMHGAEILAAGDADEAMARLHEGPIDLLVSDIGLPGQDGRELCRRALSSFPGLRAIALSAYSRPEDRASALEAGFLHYETKPVEPDVLIRNVLRVVGRGVG